MQKILQTEMSGRAKIFALQKEFDKLEKRRLSGEITNEKYKSLSAILEGALGEQRGLSDLNKLKVSDSVKQGGMDGSLESKSSSSSLGSGTEVSGKRPQSLTINIDKLVNELNVQTTNLTEGVGKIKEMVSKALLESVNDINTMATA